MGTDYRHLITNPTSSIHDDMGSARTRLHEAIDLLEQAQVNGTDTDEFTAAVADLHAAQQRLDEVASR